MASSGSQHTMWVKALRFGLLEEIIKQEYMALNDDQRKKTNN